MKLPTFNPHTGIPKNNKMQSTTYSQFDYDVEAERRTMDRSRILNVSKLNVSKLNYYIFYLLENIYFYSIKIF